MRFASIVVAAFAAALVAGSGRLAYAKSPSAVVESRSDTSQQLARYEGTWITTKPKKLDGTLSCVVKPLAKDRWQGRFWGVWQQVPFDYTVEFSAADRDRNLPATTQTGLIDPPAGQRVRGTTTIDGAHYDWVGSLTPARFDIQFTGTRYEGRMELKRLADQNPQR